MIQDISSALQSLKPGAKWTVRGTEIEWHDTSITRPTDSEISDEIARLNSLEPLRLLRIERNKRLTACDWTVCVDNQLSTDKQNEWKIYRQALRDLPSTATPKVDSYGFLKLSSVTFPTEPN
jgi:hypothetical protein